MALCWAWSAYAARWRDCAVSGSRSVFLQRQTVGLWVLWLDAGCFLHVDC